MSCAQLSENMEKNRYKDVLPCKFLQMMSKMTHLFLPDRQNYVSIKLIHNSGNAIITIIMVCECLWYVSTVSASFIVIAFLDSFFSMSIRVFESLPE